LDQTFAFQCQKGKRVGKNNENQPGDGKREGTVKAVLLMAMQNRTTARALGHTSWRQWLEVMKQITLVAGDYLSTRQLLTSKNLKIIPVRRTVQGILDREKRCHFWDSLAHLEATRLSS
jgi:hypothetical protein